MGKRSADIHETTLAVFDSASAYAPLTTTEVADSLDCTRRTAYDRLERLVDRGAIQTKKVGARGRVWWRPPDTDATDRRESDRRSSGRHADVADGREAVFDRISDAFYALDEGFRFTYVNERAAELLRRDADDLVGRSVWETVPGISDSAVGAAFREATETQTATSVETYVEPLDFRVEATVYPSESGLSVYFRDVTERTARERRLERYERIIENLPVGVYRNRPGERGEFVEANPALAEMFGADSVASFLERDAVDFYPDPDRRASFSRRLESAGVAEAVEIEQETVDGDPLWIEVTAMRVVEDGEAYFDGVVRDVTDRKRYERRLRALYDSTQALFTADSERAVSETVGDAATEALGFSEVVVYRYDAATDRLVPDPQETAASDGGTFTRKEFSPVPADGTTLVGQAFDSGETRYVADVRETQRLQMTAVDTEMRTGLYVPLGDHGVLVAGERAVDGIDGSVRHLVELLTANAAAAFDRVARERELAESRHRYRTLVENFPNGLVTLVDGDCRYVTVGGDPPSGIAGPCEEMEGRSVDAVLADEVVEELRPRYEAALDGESSTFEYTADGEVYQSRILPVQTEEGEAVAALGMSQNVTDRVERERQLASQRERLAVLNNYNAVIRTVNEALIEKSTRGEIERVVCELLADAEPYAFAWVGDVDARTRTVEPRVEAGVEGYVEDVAPSADPDAADRGVTGAAVRSRETRIVHDVVDEDRTEPRPADGEAYGFRSFAAIPIVHEDTLYGVLGVHGQRSDVFAAAERAVIAQLGETIGHAIAAVDRKRALMSDEVVELEFQIPDVSRVFDREVPADGRVELHQTVPVDDSTFLCYGTVSEEARGLLEGLCDRQSHWSSVSVIERELSDDRFELRLSDPPVLSTLAAHGGLVDEAVIEDGTYTMRIQLPPSVEVRQITDVIQGEYPTAEMIARRQKSRKGAEESARRAIADDLTDRQRAALQASFHAGFFEWPRESSGEDIAESLDVSPPTFHQHLRAAEKKVLAAVLL